MLSFFYMCIYLQNRTSLGPHLTLPVLHHQLQFRDSGHGLNLGSFTGHVGC